MTYRLFIDDERFPPNDGNQWVTARDGQAVLVAVFEHGMPSFISFDHDLGENSGTGYEIARMLVEIDMKTPHSDCRFPDDFDYYVHSQNPIGKQNIEGLLNNYFMKRGNQDASD